MLAKLGVEPADEIAAIHHEDVATGARAAAPPRPRAPQDRRSDPIPGLSVLLGVFAAPHALEGVVLVNALVAAFALWLPIQVLLRERSRERGRRLDAGMLTFAAVAAGLLGSLSFYVAFLMPDIFTPALLLIAATLTAFAPRMRPGELAACVVLGAVAVMAHTSHLAIAALLVPVVLAGSLLLGGPRRWLAPLLFAAITFTGFAQQEAARLRHWPRRGGRHRLSAVPDRAAGSGRARPRLSRCALPGCGNPDLRASHRAVAFERSLAADRTHIIFERSDRLGSFRLMSPSDQHAGRRRPGAVLPRGAGRPAGGDHRRGAAQHDAVT